MDTAIIIAALDSATRRNIISIIADNQLTLDEIFEKLSKADSGVKYRESAYRATEKLVDAGIVQKFYDKRKGICYSVAIKKIEIDLLKGQTREYGEK